MNTNAKKTTTTANADRNGFAELLRTYENATRNRNGNADTESKHTTALQELATACTFSVLKKCIQVSQNPELIKLRQGLMHNINNLQRLQYAVNNSTELEFDASGDLVSKVIDKTLDKAIEKLLDESLSDGYDLLQTAIISILSETEKIKDLSVDFMEIPYNTRRLKRKVYIKNIDSKGGFETVSTTPIQEVYKAIRRDVEGSRAIQSISKYVYISELITDNESDIETEIYRRLPKYSDLAYSAYDFNGKPTNITVDNESVCAVETLIEKMNLTTKQAAILQLRLSGYGYKAIATYLGVTDSNVKGQIAEIKRKATVIGLTPTK